MDLPRRLQIEFTRVIQDITDTTGKEITAQEIWGVFKEHYLDKNKPFELISFNTSQNAEGKDRTQVEAVIAIEGKEEKFMGEGGGSIEAFTKALNSGLRNGRVLDYHEHAIGSGADAKAVCYIELSVDGDELCNWNTSTLYLLL